MAFFDDLCERVMGVIMPKVAQMLVQHATVARTGIIVKGTYDPTDGTASVLLGDTLSVFQDQGDAPVVIPRVPIALPHTGDQYGPIGDEHVKIIPTQAGYLAVMVGYQDGSNQAPVGERWITHRNPTTSAVDVSMKFTNDGANGGGGDALVSGLGGDGLGGFSAIGGTLHTLATAGGVSRTLNDATMQAKTIAGTATSTVDATAKAITHDVAGQATSIVNGAAQNITHTVGPIYTIVDGAGNAISHVVGANGAVGLGDLASNLPSSAAGITNAHLTSLKNSIMSDMMQSFSGVYATAMQSAGIPNAGPFNAIVSAAGWITGNITPPTVPSGSAIVKLAG